MSEGTEGSTWKNITRGIESMEFSHCPVISKKNRNRCTLYVCLVFKLVISPPTPPVASPDTSVSIFSWQVKAYGQGTPTTYIGVFDINRWYHAQMPDSLRYAGGWIQEISLSLFCKEARASGSFCIIRLSSFTLFD